MPTTSANELSGILEEYKVLRTEIHNAQARRLQILSFAAGVIGVILSISTNAALSSDSTIPNRPLLIAVTGSIATYAVLVPSLMMTIATQQTIQRLGGYIGRFIEPKIPGLNWERHWQNFRKQRGTRLTGAVESVYYFLSVLPLLIPALLITQYPKGWYLLFLVIPFSVWSLYLTFDLALKYSKSWSWARWDDYVDHTSIVSLDVNTPD